MVLQKLLSTVYKYLEMFGSVFLPLQNNCHSQCQGVGGGGWLNSRVNCAVASVLMRMLYTVNRKLRFLYSAVTYPWFMSLKQDHVLSSHKRANTLDEFVYRWFIIQDSNCAVFAEWNVLWNIHKLLGLTLPNIVDFLCMVGESQM